ncbi:LysR family transcriptional regulator [Enterococcus innesii]|uniref:LysR family transcriptional regulator n=1 Tax=Enterococcus innesii TaxID=2839759 RepID=UPI003B5B08AA
MRIEQLDYLEKIIKHGSINLAAKELFLTQPTLSNAVKELEQEMRIQLFIRSKKGVVLTDEGRRFMIYANQVLAQVRLLEDQYKEQAVKKRVFAVSAQHYAFVVHAFVELIKSVDTQEYHFTLRETETEKILIDVAKFRSDLGILYVNSFNQEIMGKLFKEHDLEFTPLFTASPHVFLSRDNPLTRKSSLSLADLESYPYLSYEQGDNNSFYFSEEILSTISHKKNIKVTDRATIFNLMVGLNGYTISSGIISSELNDDKIVAVPLEVDDYITLGWLKHKQVQLSDVSIDYLDRLKEHIIGFGFEILE